MTCNCSIEGSFRFRRSRLSYFRGRCTRVWRRTAGSGDLNHDVLRAEPHFRKIVDFSALLRTNPRVISCTVPRCELRLINRAMLRFSSTRSQDLQVQHQCHRLLPSYQAHDVGKLAVIIFSMSNRAHNAGSSCRGNSCFCFSSSNTIICPKTRATASRSHLVANHKDGLPYFCCWWCLTAFVSRAE